MPVSQHAVHSESILCVTSELSHAHNTHKARAVESLLVATADDVYSTLGAQYVSLCLDQRLSWDQSLSSSPSLDQPLS